MDEAKLYEAMSVVTPVCRLGGNSLFEKSKPRGAPDEQLSYNCELLFEEGEDLTTLKRAVKAAIMLEWGDKPPKNIKMPFRDQGEKDNRAGFVDGAIFITPNSKKSRPGIVGAKIDKSTGKLEVIEDESEIYSGCYVKAALRASAYGDANSGIKPGVKFYLQHVQKVRDGDPLGGRTTPEQSFEPIESEDGDDDLDGLLDMGD